MMLLLSARMGRLSARIGPRLPMTVGPIVAGLGDGLADQGRRRHRPTSAMSLAPMLLFGFGLSFTVAPLTSTVLAAAPDHQAGIASAINNDVARVAGLLAVAVLPALAGITPAAYADPALLSAGFQRAALIAGILCAAGGVLAFARRSATHRGSAPRTGRARSRSDRPRPSSARPARCSPRTSSPADVTSPDPAPALTRDQPRLLIMTKLAHSCPDTPQTARLLP